MKIQQQILGHTKASTTLLYAEPGMAERRQASGKIQSQLLPNVAKLQLESGVNPSVEIILNC